MVSIYQLCKLIFLIRKYNETRNILKSCHYFRELVYRFNVTTIPSGVVMKADSKIITKTGVDELETLGINVLITWDY